MEKFTSEIRLSLVSSDSPSPRVSFSGRGPTLETAGKGTSRDLEWRFPSPARSCGPPGRSDFQRYPGEGRRGWRDEILPRTSSRGHPLLRRPKEGGSERDPKGSWNLSNRRRRDSQLIFLRPKKLRKRKGEPRKGLVTKVKRRPRETLPPLPPRPSNRH